MAGYLYDIVGAVSVVLQKKLAQQVQGQVRANGYG